MPQTRGTFDALYDNVDKSLSAIMKDRLRELPRIYTQIFNIKTSDRKFERVVSYVPFSDTVAKPEGVAYTTDTIRQAYTKDFTHLEYGLAFEATQTALEDDAENVLQRAGEWLAFSARYLEEGVAANVFNNGFTTETSPDGGALFSAHTLLGGGSGGRNQLATAADLSANAIQTCLIDMQTQTVDEASHLAFPIKGLILYVPPAYEFLAHRILKSQGLPQSADNDTNPYRDRRTWEIIVNPRLTDTDAFFIVASDKAAHSLCFYRRVPITQEPMAIDARTGNRIFKVRHRFSVGAWAWQGTFGTAGA